MTTPGVYFGLLIATTCGLAFHIIRGGTLGRLVLYVLTAWVTFFVGQLVGEWLNWRLLRVGTLNLFPALLATFLGLGAAAILAGPERKRQKRPRGKRRNGRRTGR